MYVSTAGKLEIANLLYQNKIVNDIEYIKFLDEPIINNMHLIEELLHTIEGNKLMAFYYKCRRKLRRILNGL
jgi:hypothetical protein